ncbi:hypothetical protein [Legionella saoudiensis]|uniref:hypothetical protein n=1 Tax=Legionella saoudiensis TaxID=1750561 RepID=UPI000731E242|nr:hypothetical protein [Legionella saoudiensis]
MDTIKNNSFDVSRNTKVFFALKKQNLMQQVLINTLMTRNNCLIDDLAKILNIDAKKLHRVWQGNATLTEKKSTELISLFYILTNSVKA